MPSPVKLQDALLDHLPPRVIRPRYDRTAVKNGIVHFGVGGFHRAHEAVYIDDLLQLGLNDWGITGIGLLPGDSRMRDALVPQDCLYTVVERSAAGENARVIGSLTRYLFVPDDPDAVLAVLSSPETRLVTLTITEGGYHFDENTKEFAAPNPISVFGYVIEALHRRRAGGIPPFTVLSCDNLPHNGDVARRVFLEFAQLRDASLADWIKHNVSFPNCMVDRITPQTTDADRAALHETFGVDDAWPVACEPFRQWVIEDRFCNGRPPLEDVGIQFTPDVFPYELMKMRLLNASHSAMGYLGYLAGYRLIPEVIADPLFHDYIKKVMDEEVTPLLAPVPGIELADYKQTLLQRFANPAIADQVSRICLDGSSKMPKFILPSIYEAARKGVPVNGLCLAVAGWFRYLTGIDEEGRSIVIDDPLAAELQSRALKGGLNPRPLLEMESVFGGLGTMGEFTEPLALALRELFYNGARSTIHSYVHGAFAGKVKRVQNRGF